MPETREATVELLRRWHAGDRTALETLLARHIEPLHRHVRSKLDRELGRLRRHFDSMDLVQTAAIRVLEYTPAFLPRDGQQFQELLRRIVINHIRNELRSPRIKRRAPSSDLFGDSVLDLRVSAGPEASPDHALTQLERQQNARAWAAMGLEFLADDGERRLVLLAAVEERSWGEIGAELGLRPNTARMRFHRLLPRLANHIRMLQEGGVPDFMPDEGT